MLRGLVIVLLALSAALTPTSSATSRATAHVIVTQQGFTHGPGFWGYGLKLVNNGDADAVNITLDVSLKTKTGSNANILAFPDTHTIWRIPAHSTFYAAGNLAPKFNAKPIGIAVKLHVGGSSSQHLPIPTITNVHVPPYVGGCSITPITGKLHNPYSRPIDPNGSTLFVVYFDRHGKILGGDDPDVFSALQATSIIPARSTLPVEDDPSDDIACKPGAVHAAFSFSPNFN
jgi:hypothetical protein